jgi:ribosome-binding protein aMBF1 (putative translation factor)
MEDFSNHCFVCGITIDPITAEKNKQLNLPVCKDCINTDREKSAVQEYLEGMADGFVCGCI